VGAAFVVGYGCNPEAAFELNEEDREREASEDHLAGPLVVVQGIGSRIPPQTLDRGFQLDPELATEVFSLFLVVGDGFAGFSRCFLVEDNLFHG
jgi:hypothetical protein